MSMKSNFRSKHGCVVCGRKSSTSRFKSSEPYKDLFQAAFRMEYKKGDFCNPCSLALNRYKKDPEGRRRDFSNRVNKCRRTGQERKPKPVPERKKMQRKQACPKKREVGPVVGLPFPNARTIKPRRKRVATPDRPWMKYTNMWKPTVVHEGGLEFDALVNTSLQTYMINLDTARPCSVCAIIKARKEGKEVEVEPSHTHITTALPPTHGHHLPPSPSTSSVDEASSPATSCSSKENMAPEMEEEEEEGMEVEGMDEEDEELGNATVENSALINYCQVAADSDFYRPQPMENAPRFLRTAPNQGIQPMPVGLVP